VGGPFLLKSYFYSPEDPRDRFGAEWAFASFAWQRGVRALAEPLACDEAARAALFRFVPGERPPPGTIGADEVAQACAFVVDVNRHRPAAARLPVASEACFSFAEHAATIERRLDRLLAIDAADPLGAKARAFVGGAVIPLFHRVVSDARGALSDVGIAAEDVLAPPQRCLSPSDFGFHNALRDTSGRVRFLDFEYAGWDDPGKLVGDFFNQVAVPVPAEFYAGFTQAMIAALDLPHREEVRFAAMRRLYAVKWAAIVLNEFSRVDRARRAFADTPVDPGRRAHQLALAEQKLDALRQELQ
jgi:hypothetical protein